MTGQLAAFLFGVGASFTLIAWADRKYWYAGIFGLHACLFALAWAAFA